MMGLTAGRGGGKSGDEAPRFPLSFPGFAMTGERGQIEGDGPHRLVVKGRLISEVGS